MDTFQNKKKKIGAQHLLNPQPAVLVGTYYDGKPNFITISCAGITSAEPPTIYIAINHIRYSLKAIQEHKTFSVNVPSASLVKETDYCGQVSGADHDKAKECDFEIFNGTLKNAPLIGQCPINFECEVIQQISVGEQTVIIGKILESYLSEDCYTDGLPDLRKINPLSYCSATAGTGGYFNLGELAGKPGD
ncbi:MAG: flavin reductase family protein [Balneolaceae bacterium]